MDSVIIDDIEITVIRKKVKNINLSIHLPTGSVRVSVPMHLHEKEIRSYLSSKIPWIQKKLTQFEEQDPSERIVYRSGERHALFGKSFVLRVVDTSGLQGVRLVGDETMELHVAPKHTVEMREHILQEWYRANLKECIPSYIAKWEAILGITINEWRIKRMKTRWGTCNVQKKRIWINLELARKPLRCLDYLIAHEMIHLLEPSHNATFYSLMDHYLPEWRALRAELNEL